MCGRYAITMPPEAMRQLFRYPERPNFPPRYNVAPTQPVPVVRIDQGQRQFVLMRWGFMPGWVKDPKTWPLVINIRSETAREKASFRAAFTRRRALMPADGFYEWHRVGKDNRPYLLRRPDRGPFAFAALWETWSAADGSEIDTVALLNTHANGLLSAIHPRAPVILDPADHDRWLDPDTAPDAAHGLLRPPPEDLLEMIPIGRAINKVANDDASVQAPARPEPDTAPEPASAGTAESPPARSPRRKVSGDGGQGSLF
jgi:putative SOS response-associated peptidase YedK